MSNNPTDLIDILLFEDNHADADLVVEYLDRSHLNYQITIAESLQEGLGRIKKKIYDVILLDLSLPDSTGISTCEKLLKETTDEIVIVLTNCDDEEHALRALQVGAQDYLFKDRLSSEVLRRSIRYATERIVVTKKLEKHTNATAYSEALLRSIFDANTDAMLILSRDYEIKFLNPAAAALLEANEASLVGETFPFEVHTGNPTEVEIPVASDRSHLAELSAVDLLWEGESALLVILRDITKRREAELGLKREKKRLSVTLDSIVDAVIATDNYGAVEHINQEASRLINVSSEEAVGKPLEAILRLKDPQSGRLLRDPATELLRPEFTEELSKTGFALEREDRKEPFIVTVEMRCILDDNGGRYGCVTVLRDITKRKKAEEELFKAEKLNSISLLAGGIAHDFNNMLTAILGNISVVRMNIDDEEDHNSRKLLSAEKAALQAKSLTQQLLTFSKGGAPVLQLTTIDKLVEESAQFILRGSNVKCEVEKDRTLWPIDADEGQISQVINNLIINADQAMPNGGTIQLVLTNKRVRYTEIATLKAGDYVCIEVRDHGTGISPDNMKRIFDPYFTTKDEGNGLGLASSYSIVKGHNGAMTVESEFGKGSSFRVYLPKTKNEAPPPQKTEETSSTEDKDTIHKGKGRILVMDDMEAMMLVAGEILSMLGYEVEFSTDGEEAIEAYKKAKASGNPFDAVVFDLTVPGGMGGEEASNILIDYDPDLIAIASSGYTNSNVMSDYENSAFKAVVPKPYRIKEMSDALHRVLQ